MSGRVGLGSGVQRVTAAAQGSFNDPENARTIHVVAVLLIVIAVVLSGWTVWWWRTTRSEHPALGPLEVMGTRRWRSAEPGLRRVRLDAARPVEEFDESLATYDDRLVKRLAVPTPPPSPPPMDPLLRTQPTE